jgi:deoxycytidylate deaminase
LAGTVISIKPIITASCIDSNGRVLATKQNSYNKTHPLQQHYAVLANKPFHIYLHAEIAAIVACKKKKIHTLIVTRFNKQGLPMNAKPCPICELAIKDYKIKRIIHT